MGAGKIAAQGLKVYVIDPSGIPLEGVSFFAQIQQKEWFSDPDGKVELDTSIRNDSLIIAAFGLETLRLPGSELEDTLVMRPLLETLDEVIVTGRRDDPVDQSIQAIRLISKKDIQFRQATSTPAVFEQSGSVFVQRSQLGGGSPILRGFEANRILLVVDGVRLNNAIYRSGHLQNSMTINAQALEQTEVILGPGSLLYGSDALGGVIHFRTQSPPPVTGTKGGTMTGQAGYQFGSAANSSVLHAQTMYSGQKWSGLMSATWSRFGDLRSGNKRPNAWPEFGKRNWFVQTIDGRDSVIANTDPNRQRFSGFEQLDLVQKLQFRPTRYLSLESNLQYSRSTNIPRYDALLETRNGHPRFAEWHYGPQTRLLAGITAKHAASNPFYDHARFQLSFQFVEEDRILRRFRDPWKEFNLEDVFVGGFTIDLDRSLDRRKQWMLNYGAEFQFNQVNSKAFREQIVEGERIFGINTRYPGEGSQLWQGGLYTLIRWHSIDSSLLLEGGLRYSFAQLHARFNNQGPIDWPGSFLAGIGSFNQAVTGSGGLRWSPGKGWSVFLHSASAFRAPNVDDFAKIRENNGFITVPNTDLRPEQAWTSELRVHKSWVWGRNRLVFSAGGFYTRIRNLITRGSFVLPNWDSFFVSRGDTLFVQANSNTDQGRIWGANATVEWHFQGWIAFTWTHTLTVGEKQVTVPFSGQPLWVPLEHIPPQFGRIALRILPGKFQIEAAVRYQGSKSVQDYGVVSIENDPNCGLIFNREGSPDNIEYGLIQSNVEPCGSPYQGLYGWATLDLYTSWQVTTKLSLNFAVENALDQHYRTFGSGISAPGRDVRVGARLAF